MIVGIVKVVNKLVFGRHFRNAAVTLYHMVKNTTVASRRNLPLKVKLEVLEFLSAIDEIATSFVIVVLLLDHLCTEDEFSFYDSPSRRQSVSVVGTPAV